MERIKIALPDTFQFSTRLKIRITDINYGGHVGNQVFLSLIHEARLQFLEAHHYSELNLEGAGLIMADAAIEYKLELDRGNEVKISVAAQNFSKLGFDIFYLLEIKNNGGWKTAAKAKTGMICFDYTTKKKVSLPQKAIDKFNQSVQ